MVKKLGIPLSVVVIVGLIVGVVWWQSGDSTASDAEEKPLAVTRQVERRTLTRELQVSGTIDRIEVQTISVATPGNISDIEIEDGDLINVGDVIFSLDGRPGVAVQGETPFFRNLDVGSRGPDVRQLEEALDDFGYSPGTIDDLFTLDTRTALAGFQNDRDYPASSPEVGETITLSLMSNPVGYDVGAQNTASITIDPLLTPETTSSGGASVAFGATAQGTPPTVSIQTSTVVAAEGTIAKYSLVLDSPSTTDITVGISTSGTATSGEDYSAPVPPQVTIPAGMRTAELNIQTVQDGLVENSERLVVTVLPDSGATPTYTVAAAPANVAQTDIADDDLPRLNLASSGTVIEGGVATLTISSDQPVLSDTTVSLVEPLTSGLGGGAGEAAADTDYRSFPSVITIPAGQREAIISVQTFVDTDVEGDEEIVVQIEASPGYEVGSQNAALITIKDSTTVTAPILTIESDNTTNAEGGNAPFTIRATAALPDPYDIAWSIAGTAQAGSDYEVPANFVTTMAANATTAAVNIALVGDDVIEADRSLSVTLTPIPAGAVSVYSLGAPTTAETIIEDDDVPELNVTGTVSIREGQTAVVTITADQPALTDLTVALQISGSAQANADFEPVSSSIVLRAGATVITVPIEVLPDTSIEPNEDVTIGLAGAGAGGGGTYTVGDDASATVTIIDSVGTDVGPVLSISSSTAQVSEGQQVTFTIGASVPSTREIDVEIALSGSAVNNTDFTFPTQDVVLAVGQTQVQLAVTIRQDDLIEPDKQIVVSLLDGRGYSVALPTRASVNIVDDDVPELTLSTTTVTLAEGSEAAFLIRADQAPQKSVSINYQVSGSAQPGSDFETLSGTAILSAGQSEIIIPLRTLNDDVVFRPTDMIAAIWPGRAGKIFIEEGQSLLDGAPLFEVTEDDFSIRLELSPNQRAELEIGMVADVEIDASNLETVGQVTELDENATINASGVETYEGRVAIGSELAVVDGSQARITIVVEEAVDTLVVPVAAVFQGPDGDAVRGLDLDTGAIMEVTVVTGLDEDSFVEIKEGLHEGDLIIIEVN